MQARENLLNSIFCPLTFESKDQTGPGEETLDQFLTFLFHVIRNGRVVQPRSKDVCNSIRESL